jgi:hypothetical protein
MSYLIFILIFLAGLLIVFLLSDKFTLLELLGLPLIIGLGYTSFVMFFLDALKVGLRYSTIVTALIVTIAIAVATLIFLYTKKIRSLDFLKSKNQR